MIIYIKIFFIYTPDDENIVGEMLNAIKILSLDVTLCKLIYFVIT